MILTPEQVQQFREQGFFIIDPLFGPVELDAIVADFARFRALPCRSAACGADSGRCTPMLECT
jgi:hypothetical protein